MEKGVVIDLNGLVRVVLKLAGLVLAVYGAASLASYFPALLSRSSPVETLAFISGPAVFILAGLFLWLFPTPVANTVIRNDGSVEDGRLWADSLIEGGSVLIGLWWLITAVSDLVYHFMVKQAQDDALGYVQDNSDLGAYVAATVVELVLALALILGARGITGLLRWLRYGGLATDRSQP